MEFPRLPIAGDVLKPLTAVVKGDVLTTITFTTLKCNDTEDTWGHDEPYLKFHIDKTIAQLDDMVKRSLQDAIDRTGLGAVVLNPPSGGIPLAPMTEGDPPRSVDRTFVVIPGRKMVVQLYDSDTGPTGSLDPDDLLGEVSIEVRPPGTAISDFVIADWNMNSSLGFSEDGAEYALGYKVTRFKLTDETDGSAVPPILEDPLKEVHKVVGNLIRDFG